MAYGAFPDIHKTHCCGVLEIDALGTAKTPVDAFKAILQGLWYGGGSREGKCLSPFVTFVCALPTEIRPGVYEKKYLSSHDGMRTNDYGEDFAKFLEGSGLGEVQRSEVGKNWTGNPIRVYVWKPDYDAVWKLAKELGVEINPQTCREWMEAYWKRHGEP